MGESALERFAVTDGPDGTRVVELAGDRYDAVRLRARHRNQFYCSTAALGCGEPLELNAGPKVRPYFHHQPGKAEFCPAVLGGGGAEGYEHLLAKELLLQWMTIQGLTARVEYRIDRGRADVHVQVAQYRAIVEVQISPLTVRGWRERDATYRQTANSVTWLLPADSPQAAHQIAEHGYSLELDPRTRQVHTHAAGASATSPLNACSMRPDGIWTPDIDSAVAGHLARHQQPAALLVNPYVPSAVRRDPLPPLINAAEVLESNQTRLYAYPDFDAWRSRTGLPLQDLPPHLHALGLNVAYYVTHLAYSGPVLGIPRSAASREDLRAVLGWLEAARLVRIENVGSVERWTRAST